MINARMTEAEQLANGIWTTQKELADLLKISTSLVNKIIQEKKISTVAKGSKLRVLFEKSVRAFLEERGLKPYKGVIAVHLLKGGVGKTTIVHGLASRSAALGLRTLMLDMDMQGNLSSTFQSYPEVQVQPTLFDVYSSKYHKSLFNGKKVTIEDAIVVKTDFLHILPSNSKFAQFDTQVFMDALKVNYATLLKNMLEPVRDNYDVIFIDCPPALTYLTSAAHCFSDQILMPVNTDKFSLENLQGTMEHIENLKAMHPDVNPECRVLINKWDSRHAVGYDIKDVLKADYPKELMKSFIGVSKQLENKLYDEMCIWSARGKSLALEDMNQVLVELLKLDRWAVEWKAADTKATAKASKVPAKPTKPIRKVARGRSEVRADG